MTLRDCKYDNPVNSITIITWVCGTESMESQSAREWQKSASSGCHPIPFLINSIDIGCQNVNDHV